MPRRRPPASTPRDPPPPPRPWLQPQRQRQGQRLRSPSLRASCLEPPRPPLAPPSRSTPPCPWPPPPPLPPPPPPTSQAPPPWSAAPHTARPRPTDNTGVSRGVSRSAPLLAAPLSRTRRASAPPPRSPHAGEPTLTGATSGPTRTAQSAQAPPAQCWAETRTRNRPPRLAEPRPMDEGALPPTTSKWQSKLTLGSASPQGPFTSGRASTATLAPPPRPPPPRQQLRPQQPELELELPGAVRETPCPGPPARQARGPARGTPTLPLRWSVPPRPRLPPPRAGVAPEPASPPSASSPGRATRRTRWTCQRTLSRLCTSGSGLGRPLRR
mmetsp:Transcript_19293/g.73938  ORF Transcript_19293/g.73938 Transcript_19293/m.73938 type:complete len:327 (+) Transcript_19293:1352-2332(+)